MNKKYVARQIALTMRNFQKGFLNPVFLEINLYGYQEALLERVMENDEYLDSLKRYGFEWNVFGKVVSYKGIEMVDETIVSFETLINNIPDKRVREYLCSMNQSISQ